MSPQFALPTAADRTHRILRWSSAATLAALVFWAGFWLWFSISVVISERTLAWQPYTFIGSIIGLSIAAWKFPRAGGILMIVAALFAGYYYNNEWARGLLALPALVIGVARFAIASLPTVAKSLNPGTGES